MIYRTKFIFKIVKYFRDSLICIALYYKNTSTSRLLTISVNSSCLSKVCMPSLPSVMHNILNVASNTSILFEYIIKLQKHLFIKIRELLLYYTYKNDRKLTWLYMAHVRMPRITPLPFLVLHRYFCNPLTKILLKQQW